MKDLLTDVSPELVDEFAQDFFAGRGRKVLHDSKRWRVLDTWIGNPPELHRQVYMQWLHLTMPCLLHAPCGPLALCTSAQQLPACVLNCACILMTRQSLSSDDTFLIDRRAPNQ